MKPDVDERRERALAEIERLKTPGFRDEEHAIAFRELLSLSGFALRGLLALLRTPWALWGSSERLARGWVAWMGEQTAAAGYPRTRSQVRGLPRRGGVRRFFDSSWSLSRS